MSDHFRDAGGPDRRAGPVGLLCHGIFAPDFMQPVRTRALLAEAALQEVDLCFLRGAHDVVAGTVAVARWQGGQWREATIPLPPVVFIINTPENDASARMDDWLRASTTVLGAKQRDKLGVAEKLVGTRWERHLIPSERLTPDGIERRLADWLEGGGIVVKANDGMRGVGVRFVLPAGEGRWEVINGERREVLETDAALASVARGVRGRMAYRDYIVQRYIDSRDRAGRPGTVRADLARQPGGGWKTFRVTGRVAPPGQIVSTASRGASLMAIGPFLATRGIADVAQKIDEVDTLSVAIADMLTTQDTAYFYEWGIDLVTDPDGHLWFLEANTRTLTYGGELERATHVIAYAKSLLA